MIEDAPSPAVSVNNSPHAVTGDNNTITDGAIVAALLDELRAQRQQTNEAFAIVRELLARLDGK